MKKITQLFALSLVGLLVAACDVAKLSLNIKTSGNLENLEGQAIPDESFALCLRIKYVLQGTPRENYIWTSALSNSAGQIDTDLTWNFDFFGESTNEFYVTDYSVSVGGLPSSSVEIENKSSPAEISTFTVSPGGLATSKAKIKVRIRASTSDLRVANIWQQARFITSDPDLEALLKDFVSRYRGNVSGEQAVRLSSLLANARQLNYAYKDSFLVHYFEVNQNNITAEERLRLLQALDFASSRDKILNAPWAKQ